MSWLRRKFCNHIGWESIGLDRVTKKCLRCGKFLGTLPKEETERIRKQDQKERESAIKKWQADFDAAPKVTIGCSVYFHQHGQWRTLCQGGSIAVPQSQEFEINLAYAKQKTSLLDGDLAVVPSGNEDSLGEKP